MKARRRALLRLGGIGGDGLAPPGVPEFTLEADSGDGEIIIHVTDEPDTWGDLLVAGDGLGAEGYIRWWNAYNGWQILIDPSDTGDFPFTLHPSLWGTVATIRLQGVSDSGALGLIATDTIAVPGEEQTKFNVTSTGDRVVSGGSSNPVVVYDVA